MVWLRIVYETVAKNYSVQAPSSESSSGTGRIASNVAPSHPRKISLMVGRSPQFLFWPLCSLLECPHDIVTALLEGRDSKDSEQ